MSRILNRQRQLAEQGRLRLGYTVPATTKTGKPIDKPVRSETWVITSHSREHVEHAAHLWGGTPEEWQPMGNGAAQHRVITEARAIPAILPPGDPLTQAYEQWNRGGCVRRCDGVTESFSGSPCICLNQHGDTWYELGPKDVCTSKSRLKVLLPDMPGLGTWRMETGSFYATDEIAGMVDTLRGAVGDQILIPVTLRIEPRTRVAGGQTKQFTVPVVELRGVNAGALLGGQAIDRRMLATGNPDSATPLAIQASAADPYADYLSDLEDAGSLEMLAALWDSAAAEGLVGKRSEPSQQRADFVNAWKAKAAELKAAEQKPADPQPDAEGIYEGETVDDPPPAAAEGDEEAVWQLVVAEAGKQGMTLADLQDDFPARMGGITSDSASAAEMRKYIELLTSGEAA